VLYFTTFFDSNYLPKGIILYNSLLTVTKQPFKLYLLCLDEITFDFFIHNKVDFEYVELIKISDFEKNNHELESVKQNRSLVEYYFTLSPVLPLYIIQKYNLDHICSMDADLFFYSSPENIFDSLSKYSLIITPHKFSKELKDREKYGLYNVSFQIFKNDEIGVKCLTKWKKECINWCFDEYDEVNKRFADQKYLDNWQDVYSSKLLVLDGPDTGLAIWNINNYNLNISNSCFSSNEKKVIFYHFHNFKSVKKNIALNGFFNYKVNRNKITDIIYNNYWEELNTTLEKYNLNIDKSIRVKQSTLLSKILNECTFYYFHSNSIFHFNLKFIPKLIRKIFIKLYG
jgi:hypothetical protein